MSNAETARKAYAAPRIIHTEKLEARASTCGKADSVCTTQQPPGPLQS